MAESSAPSSLPLALLIREKDLPALLGVSRAFIRKRLAAGQFPQPIRLGRCVLWKRQALVTWIEAGCPAVS